MQFLVLVGCWIAWVFQLFNPVSGVITRETIWRLPVERESNVETKSGSPDSTAHTSVFCVAEYNDPFFFEPDRIQVRLLQLDKCICEPRIPQFTALREEAAHSCLFKILSALPIKLGIFSAKAIVKKDALQPAARLSEILKCNVCQNQSEFIGYFALQINSGNLNNWPLAINNSLNAPSRSPRSRTRGTGRPCSKQDCRKQAAQTNYTGGVMLPSNVSSFLCGVRHSPLLAQIILLGSFGFAAYFLTGYGAYVWDRNRVLACSLIVLGVSILSLLVAFVSMASSCRWVAEEPSNAHTNEQRKDDYQVDKCIV